MPTISFVTPPGRPSILREHTLQEAKAQHADSPALAESKHPTSTLRFSNTESTPNPDQLVKPVPLTFPKRILHQLTTSPEPAPESFDLPQTCISVDEAKSARMLAGESNRPSLLSTTIVASSAHPSRSASTTNLGILRKADSEILRKSLEAVVREAADVSDSTTTAAPRPRLHFVEPPKQPGTHLSTRNEAALGRVSSAEKSESDSTLSHPPAHSTAAAPASQPPQPTTPAKPTLRKRSLVIQEHADVIERAAERAARQANHLSTLALEQLAPTATSASRRQHSASSAGEETASTRSSWAQRSNSRGSSVATSPSVVSEDNLQDPPELQLPKPSESPPMASIFSQPMTSDRGDPRPLPAPITSSRKLTFISPAPSKRRRSCDANPVSPSGPASGRTDASMSQLPSALDDTDEQKPSDTSRRALAFAVCPKPERAVRLSPAHATRKPKSKLSASPAPHKLAYPQRLRGIRGTDPIRSPAPDKPGLTSAPAEQWNQRLDDVSSEGSGYSEDEEDGDSDQVDEDEDEDEDDDDASLSESSRSDLQSLAESLLEESQDHTDLQSVGVSPSPSDRVTEMRPEAAELGALDRRVFDWNARPAQHRAVLSDSEPRPDQNSSHRRSSVGAQGQHSVADPVLASQTSPPRLPQSTRSKQASPLSALPGRSTYKLKPKDSLSHPMCFLPDAFEDSAPPTPTEPDSDASEVPPRSNLLSGWLSEGGSAASSRRASWQQPHPHYPPPASPRGRSGDEEGLAVPITLPPFRRARERTAPLGVTSDGEQSSRSLSGNAAFIRESAGVSQTPIGGEERSEVPSAAASPYASSVAHVLGISVPSRRPCQTVSWRHLSSQHVLVSEHPSAGPGAFRRASHSMEPRKMGSAVTSPIGSYTHATGRVTPLSERPMRPSAGKQRAVSSSSSIRSRPLVAQSMHDDIVVATSPPRDDASTHLKHHLAHSPMTSGQHVSGSTTPGWMSDGQLPNQTTSRYWTERLSSLAQAMSEELSIVGNAVLGKDKGAVEVGQAEGCVNGDAHRRSSSVPLEVAVDAESREKVKQPLAEAVSIGSWARRESTSIPVPVKPKPADAWTTDRDGQTQVPPKRRSRQRSARATESDAQAAQDNSSTDLAEAKRFQFAKKEVGEDGSTRLVVIHTSDAT